MLTFRITRLMFLEAAWRILMRREPRMKLVYGTAIAVLLAEPLCWTAFRGGGLTGAWLRLFLAAQAYLLLCALNLAVWVGRALGNLRKNCGYTCALRADEDGLLYGTAADAASFEWVRLTPDMPVERLRLSHQVWLDPARGREGAFTLLPRRALAADPALSAAFRDTYRNA